MTGAAQISQIHLIHERTGARTVIHIGSSVRGSEREIALEGALPVGAIGIPGAPNNTKIVKLRFSQVNPITYDAPIVVELVSGEVELYVNGHSARPLGISPGLIGAPLPHNATIKLDDEAFRAEIHAHGRLPPPRIVPSWSTVVGPVQELNEDALGLYQDKRAHLYVLADGVGGAEAGERVSEFAVKWMLMTFHYYLRGREDEELDWQSMLATAYHSINTEVRHFSRLSAAPAGSTLTTVILHGWDLYVAHVGDSRLYLWNGMHLRRVTSDHVTFFSEKGVRGTARRALLLKAIGKADTIEPDIFVLRLQPDDRLLMVTDGIHNALNDDHIARVIKDTGLSSLPERLINEANEHYNSDNLSVIAVRAQALGAGFTRPEKPNMRALPKAPRVYIGYDRRWRVRLKASEELATHPKAGAIYNLKRLARKTITRRNVAIAAVIVLLILFIGLPAAWVVRTFTPVSVSASDAAATQAQAATQTQRALLFIDTPVRTPSPVPTATQPPLPTPSPEFTSAPPTITLPPFPTITLPPGFGSN
ncbi:MAG: protein phosphatase 2C domain-containing protein [Anaerolineae bacterium]